MEEISPEFQEKFIKRVEELWEAFHNGSIRVMIIILAAEMDRLLLELIKRITCVIKEELTLMKIERTPDRFFQCG